MLRKDGEREDMEISADEEEEKLHGEAGQESKK